MSSTKSKEKVSRRDNFTQSVIQILYKRAGGRCCRCNAATFGPVSNNPTKSVNIGQGAHIAAAAPGGPRYDPKMSSADRASAANGMWMCANCHDIIDRDVEAFPTAALKTMKKEAERRAKDLMGVGTLMEGRDAGNSLSVGVSASTIVEIRKAKAEILALNGESIGQSQGEKLLALVGFINPEIDSYLPEVGSEITAFFDQLLAHCTVPDIVLEVLRRLKILADTFNGQWTKEDVKQISEVSLRVLTRVKSKRNRVYQSGAALLKDLSTYSTLKDKGLHKIPVSHLKELRGVEQTDSGPKPKKPRLSVADEASGPPPMSSVADEASGPPSMSSVADEASGPPSMSSDGDQYLELMECLSTCEDPKKVDEIEEELMKMGYEPNIV